MSRAPSVRRTDKLMSDERVRETLSRAHSGRLATVGADGWPYIVPLLFVCMNGEIWVHNTGARGHLRENIDHEPRVCFEVDEPGDVFAYGRFECDTSVAYCSVVAFGRIRVLPGAQQKSAFFEALMEKYGDRRLGRPQGFFPRLHQVTVYSIAIERMTGKQTPLPAMQDRFPSLDQTKSPDAVP
jgi:uncharacterized protein